MTVLRETIIKLNIKPYRNWISCGLIAIACITLMVLPKSVSDSLVLNHSAISQWEVWRLFTAHFVHTNTWHLSLNIAGLGLTWLLFYEYFTPARISLVIMICTLGLSLVLFFTNNLQDITWYAGLSGTLHGLFAFGLVLELSQKRITTYVMIVFGTTKLAYEQLGGSTDSTAALIGATVAIDAHLWGAALGTLAGFMVKARNKP